MKKISLLLFIVFSVNGLLHSQTAPRFKVTKDGVKPVVISFDTSYNAHLIYTRVKEWISMNNKSPKAVTKIDNENSLVKFSCYKEKGWHIKNAGIDLWNDLAYTLAVEIKTGKCRVTFVSDETRYKVWYNKDGSLNKNFKESESTFENTINETLTSLYNHIKGDKKKVKDDW
jgi:uncharacterized protein YjhX (UPF0386 family)